MTGTIELIILLLLMIIQHGGDDAQLQTIYTDRYLKERLRQHVGHLFRLKMHRVKKNCVRSDYLFVFIPKQVVLLQLGPNKWKIVCAFNGARKFFKNKLILSAGKKSARLDKSLEICQK